MLAAATANAAARPLLRHDDGLHRCVFAGEVIQRDLAGRTVAVGAVEDGEYRIRFPGLATFAYRPGEPCARFDGTPETPRRVIDNVFRTAALPLILQAEGCEALHASAVQTPAGLIAFCGFSGTGKTTLAYAFARRGYPTWADDAVLLSFSSGGSGVPVAIRLPYTLNLRRRSREFFGLSDDGEIDVPASPDDEDRLVAVVALASDAGWSFDLRLLPLDEALAAVLPHAHCFFGDEAREQRTVTAYLNLAASVPVVHFGYFSDFAGFEDSLDALENCLKTVAGF